MNKLLIGALIAVTSAIAMADPLDIVFTQRRLDDSGTDIRIVTHPTGPNAMWYDYSTNRPAFLSLGSGLAINSGVLSATAAAQVNSDWNASSGTAQILNRPTLAPVATSGAYSSLTGTPALASVATSGDYNSLINKPAIQSIQRTRVQTTTAGTYTWTFPAAYTAGTLPVVEITVEDNSGATWNHQITAISNTSVTLQLTKTTAVTLLGISVLGIAATPQAYVHLTAVAP